MRKIFLTILMCVPLSGQEKEALQLDPHFMAIIVKDINNTINWYSENFDFEVLNFVESEERGFKQANLRRGNILIELIELKQVLHTEEILKTKPPKTKIAGYFKFGFQVSDFDGWMRKLSESGVEFYGSAVQDPNSGKRTILVIDPDGNRIQIFEK